MGRLLDRSVLDGKTIEIFRAAVKSKRTLDPYERRLIGFLKWNGKTCDQFVNSAKKNPKKAEEAIIKFVLLEKARAEKREIANSTISNTLKPVKLLLEMNDVILNWKKIKKLLPSARRFALDRIPTMDELRAIVENSDMRGRALTLAFCTSGIREGAVEWLKVGNFSPVKIDKTTLGRLVVYEGEEEQYVTFVSPEAYDALTKYVAWRKEHGEEIKSDSPLFRDKFDAVLTQKFLTYGGGIPERAKRMTGATVRAYYNRLFHELGYRDSPKRRYDFSVHGFRKFFKTKMENAGAKPIVTEILMGHSVGISDSYYRPSEKDLLEDYLKALKDLAILEKTELKIQMEEQKSGFEERFAAVEDTLNSLVASAAAARQSAQQ